MSLLTEKDRARTAEIVHSLFNDSQVGLSVQVSAGAAIQNLLSTLKATEQQLSAITAELDALKARIEQESSSPNYERMFNAAIIALSEISEYVGADPDDGGATPIIEKLEELRNQKPDTQELINKFRLFLEWLPDDLGKGSLNGMKAQLQEAIRVRECNP